MYRLDRSVNFIIKGILATSLRYTSRIRVYILIVDRTNYIIHIVYTLLRAMLDDNYYYYMDLRLLCTCMHIILLSLE